MLTAERLEGRLQEALNFFLVGMRVESLTQVSKNTKVISTKVGKWGLLHMGKK